jgi:hypothetical protein
MTRLIVLLLLFITITSSAFAGWTEPIEVLNGGWGSGRSEFGVYEGDTDTWQPILSSVLPDGKIIISDHVNDRQVVFNDSGTLHKIVPYIDHPYKNGMVYQEIPEYSVSKVKRFMSEGGLYSDSGDKYYLYSSIGTLISTLKEKPLELGIVEHRSVGNSMDITLIRYNDISYSLNGYINDFVRDQNDYIYSFGSYTETDPVSGRESLASYVNKYDKCGVKIGELDIPVSEYEPVSEAEMNSHTGPNWIVRNKYGPPVIGPDGTIYAWKRTPDTYSILKWTWLNEPSDPKSDCSK